MPEDSKKNDKKNAKEQRKPRQRHQQSKTEKRLEKSEESNSAPKVPQKLPVYESPPPEFYKGLKRETDEILKITEEESSKYKKKEIQSNWSKYEVPIESYEEIEAQENLGADYEKLIETPLSLGGHFQFKHEKSWDINTCCTQYDKYFEINMEDLNIALCTVPFYIRNNIEPSAFSETDMLNMNNRSTRFKQKYYNDKSYSTPDIEAQDKILNSLRNTDDSAKDIEMTNDINITNDMVENSANVTTDINLQLKSEPLIDCNKIEEDNILNTPKILQTEPKKTSSPSIEHDDFIFEKPSKSDVGKSVEPSAKIPDVKVEPQIEVINMTHKNKPIVPAPATPVIPLAPTVAEAPVSTNNAVIESPEDLEKWLDDFLDG